MKTKQPGQIYEPYEIILTLATKIKMSIDFCDECYEVNGLACGSSVTLEAAFTPGNTRYLWVENPRNPQEFYVDQVTVNGSGDLVMTLSAYPDGMFTEYSGSYRVTVSTSQTVDTNETITVGAKNYKCYILRFNKTTGV